MSTGSPCLLFVGSDRWQRRVHFWKMVMTPQPYHLLFIPMTVREAQLDDLLSAYGVKRGSAQNVNIGVTATYLQSGDRIEFEPAGVTVIAGANNCGKSTMLRELNLLLLGHDGNPRLIVGSVERLFEGEPVDFADWLIKHAQFNIDRNQPENASFLRFEHGIPVKGFLIPDHGGYGASFRMESLFGVFVRHLPAGQRDIHPGRQKETVLAPATEPLQLLSESKTLMDELNAITFKILKKRLHLDDLNPTLVLRVGTPTVERPQGKYEDPVSYQLDVESLPLLSDQGDGMKSLLNILIPLVTATYPILIIDEPEAFLHPPQAFALGQVLGRIAAEKRLQLILATHDRNIMAGLVNAEAPLSVVRLVKQQDKPTRAHQLKSQDLRAIMKDPILKYSHVLDGLFHEVVILAEAERDCRFYEAALDEYENASSTTPQVPSPMPATEVLFIPTGGTSNMPRLAKALRSLNVPVVACADLDVLDKKTVLKNIVEGVGGQWAGLEEDWNAVVAPLNAAAPLEHAVTVGSRVQAVFESLVSQDAFAIFDGDARKLVNDAMKAQSRPWDEVKHHGISELQRVNVENPRAVHRLVAGLADQGVVVVEAGELESFGHDLGAYKGKTWLPAALAANLQSRPDVQAHVKRLLGAAVPLTSWNDTSTPLA
ncbi:ATP-binding protein [Paenarthrobacter sp. AR 02]|uniref:ATP-dependent nuclease n=1 Tax=Paenarthrobacter sp. AR 02 TaxID=2899821 RepID=UPI001F24DAA0|nr:AAA family ATPase [Paenarthrobacter sp. AR 02]MCF3139699.1 ATP-binding protein [Paenarthrobacter sp. AR 02]